MEMIDRYLSGRRQQDVYDSTTSVPLTLNYELPHGSIKGSIILSFYIFVFFVELNIITFITTLYLTFDVKSQDSPKKILWIFLLITIYH